MTYLEVTHAAGCAPCLLASRRSDAAMFLLVNWMFAATSMFLLATTVRWPVQRRSQTASSLRQNSDQQRALPQPASHRRCAPCLHADALPGPPVGSRVIAAAGQARQVLHIQAHVCQRAEAATYIGRDSRVARLVSSTRPRAHPQMQQTGRHNPTGTAVDAADRVFSRQEACSTRMQQTGSADRKRAAQGCSWATGPRKAVPCPQPTRSYRFG